jgi:hypothetical protein
MKKHWITTSIVIIGLVAMVAIAQEPPKSEEGVTPVGRVTKLDHPGPQNATLGQAWITYDDGTQEDWGTTYSSGGAVGNKFVQLGTAWASFYCDGISAYVDYSGNVWMTGHVGINTAGTALTGYTDDLMLNTGSGTGWLTWDAATTAGDFFANTTFTWQDTAWIAAYYSDDLGVDTNGGTPHHGFSVSSYTGSGYTEESMNVMLRARFNGPGVPVELMTFTAE